MRSKLLLTALLVAAAASPPALAQQSQEVGGIPTETQRRLARADSGQIPWDLLGLFGLLSLPASVIYRCERGWPRQAATAMTLRNVPCR